MIDAELLSTCSDAELRFGVRAPGWCREVQSVQEVGCAVVVTGRLTIPTADGDLLHYLKGVGRPVSLVRIPPQPDEPCPREILTPLPWRRYWMAAKPGS